MVRKVQTDTHIVYYYLLEHVSHNEANNGTDSAVCCRHYAL